MNFFLIIFILFSVSGCMNQGSGRNNAGLDAEGFDSEGFKDGYDRQGYGRNGCNRKNFDRLGNACKEVVKIKEKNLSPKQIESAQSNIDNLNKEKEELRVSIGKSEQDKQTQIQKLTQAVSIKDADILQKTALINQNNITINTLQSQLAQQTQDASSWKQQYTNENLLLAQCNTDLNLAQTAFVIKNNELLVSQKNEGDTKLELQRVQDIADALDKDMKEAQNTENELRCKLENAHKVVNVFEKSIIVETSKLDLNIAGHILGNSQKLAQKPQALKKQLAKFFLYLNAASGDTAGGGKVIKQLFANTQKATPQFIRTGLRKRSQSTDGMLQSSPEGLKIIGADNINKASMIKTQNQQPFSPSKFPSHKWANNYDKDEEVKTVSPSKTAPTHNWFNKYDDSDED